MKPSGLSLAPPAEAQAPARAMALLGAVVFVVSLGYGAGLPLIQPYLAQYLGPDAPQRLAWHVGMLGGVYTFALFLFAPWWGRLSDRHGRPLILMAGFTAFLAGSAAAALAPNLGTVYAARLLAGAGAAAIVPTAQAAIADISGAVDRSRRFVLLGSASFLGFLAGPAFGTWLAGPVMGMSVGQMPGMINWPALSIAIVGIPILLLAPRSLARHRAATLPAGVPTTTLARRRFVLASMLLAALASFAVGTFEVGFTLFGGQTLGLTGSTLAIMFVTCSVAMLAAQAMLLLPAVRRRIDQRWVAAAFAASALALGFAAVVSGAGALGLLIAVVGTGVGLIGPVLSYELLERERSEPGALLGRQAAAGNLGLALGSFSAGSLFALHPAAPFGLAALVLLFGAGAALALWGPARDDEISLLARSELERDG
ncbi:MAG: MFS transporter [Burkholderiaceae bacterium]|nr:MFS transporter [Burkholderiaceae bacterium]